MRGYFIDPTGRYYEGDRADSSHQSVPRRPGADYEYSSGAWAKSLAVAKAAKIAALDADRKRIETLPITGNQGGKTFHISRPEKVNEFLMGGLSIALGSSPAATFTMLDDNGVEIEYSKALMGSIIRVINSSKAPSLARYAARKAAVEAAATAAAVESVNANLSEA